MVPVVHRAPRGHFDEGRLDLEAPRESGTSNGLHTEVRAVEEWAFGGWACRGSSEEEKPRGTQSGWV